MNLADNFIYHLVRSGRTLLSMIAVIFFKAYTAIKQIKGTYPFKN